MKHLHFILQCSTIYSLPVKIDGKNVFGAVNSDKELLGFIQYYKKWKCYVWEQGNGVIMSKSCLDELTIFMKKLDDKL